jgi:hypothetical protein
MAAETGCHVDEGWCVRKDGTTFWANVVTTALRDAEDCIAGFGVVIRHISDKKAVHDAVLENERRLRLLVQGVTDYRLVLVVLRQLLKCFDEMGIVYATANDDEDSLFSRLLSHCATNHVLFATLTQKAHVLGFCLPPVARRQTFRERGATNAHPADIR